MIFFSIHYGKTHAMVGLPQDDTVGNLKEAHIKRHSKRTTLAQSLQGTAYK